MQRNIAPMAVMLVCLLLASGIHGQAQQPSLSIHPASSTPMDGWQPMALGNGMVWVSPVASVTSADIQDAQPLKRPNGDDAVTVTFTDAGLTKLRELFTAQYDKPVAVVFDGQVIWAPVIREAPTRNPIVLMVARPNGRTQEVAERLAASLRR